MTYFRNYSRFSILKLILPVAQKKHVLMPHGSTHRKLMFDIKFIILEHSADLILPYPLYPQKSADIIKLRIFVTLTKGF